MIRKFAPRYTISDEELERVRLDFTLRGESIVGWARQQGFRPDVVYQVLSGRSLAIRGESHRVALALGLKPAIPKPLAVVRSTLNNEEPHM